MFLQHIQQLAEPSYKKEKYTRKAESYHIKFQYILFSKLLLAYYSEMENICYAIVMSARKLWHYFKTPRVRVLTNQSLNDIFRNGVCLGRIGKWAMDLSEHVVDFEKRSAIKSQVLADFIADWTEPSCYTAGTVIDIPWQVHCDGAWGSPEWERQQY
jgi:hypothetical protein